MKSIQLTNSELLSLELELNDIASKKLTIKQKFLALDMGNELSAKIKPFRELQQEIVKEYGTLQEDGNSYKIENEEGLEKLKELVTQTVEFNYNPDFIESVLELETEGVPFTLYKLHNDSK